MSRYFIINAGIPYVQVREGVEGDDVVGDGLDGVVVEQQPLQALVPRALPRHLHQLVPGQVCKYCQLLLLLSSLCMYMFEIWIS